MEKNVHTKSHKIKELQVMSITRQDFDDSNIETDDTNIFQKTDTFSKQNSQLTEPKNFNAQEDVSPLKELPPLKESLKNEQLVKPYEPQEKMQEETPEYLQNINTAISGWAFKENVDEIKDLASNMDKELADQRSWRLQEQDLLEQEIQKNREEMTKKREEKIKKELQALDQEQKDYENQFTQEEAYLAERLKNVYSNYNPDSGPKYKSIKRTNIDRTDDITQKLNEGENRLRKVKNFTQAKNDMDSVLSDITKRLKEYDEFSESMNSFSQNNQDNEFLDRLSANNSTNSIRPSPSGSENVIKRPSIYNLPKDKENKKWEELLPMSPPTGFENYNFLKRSQASQLQGEIIENQNIGDNNVVNNNNSSRWWKDYEYKNLGQGKEINDCFDDIDKEFEELEKMIEDAGIENSI